MGIKGAIMVEKVDAREEVVVPRVQGTIHPFSLSAIKSQASLFISRTVPIHIFPMVHCVGIYRSLDNACVTLNSNGTHFFLSRWHVVNGAQKYYCSAAPSLGA